MVYEQCLADRNATLINLFGHAERIPSELPAAGTLLNFSNGIGSLENIIMPELAECDLEKELDNVSSTLCRIISLNIVHSTHNSHYSFITDATTMKSLNN